VSGVTQPVLGIDLGTTHTVAALRGSDGRVQPLLFHSSFLLPSAVYADSDGRLLVGRDAERSARLDPMRYEPNPKRRVDEGSVLLGSRPVPVADLLAALLRRVGDEAARVAGALPARSVLTYPANWAGSRRAVLTEAAERAGLPSVTLVPEPVAAAFYFTTVMGNEVPPGGILVVYDFGGGTFDTSVLRRRPDGGWDVLVGDGIYDLGGVDLDAAIVAHLGRTLAARDPGLWQRLSQPVDDSTRRRLLLLREEARAAKEQLSRSSSASVPVPLFDVDMVLTREEFEALARPYLQRTVDLTAATLQRAGVRADQIRGLFLVGGSSRVPLVSTLLHQRLAVAPTLIEQPELVVALGSLLAAAEPHGLPGQSVPPEPANPAPMSPPMSPPPLVVPLVPVRSRYGARIPVLAGLVAVVLVLCGLGGFAAWRAIADTGRHNPNDPNTGATRNGSTVRSTAGGGVLSAKAGAAHQAVAVNKTVWYANVKLTFGQVVYDGTKTSNQLTADVVVENTGTQTVDPSLPIGFVDGNAQAEAFVGTGTPVQSGTKTDVTYTFTLRNLSASLADGVFTVGRGDEAQAVVPVTDKAALVDYKPRQVLANVAFQFRDLRVHITGCELRGGWPYQFGQAKKGYLMLYCVMDLTYTGTFAGGLYIGRESFGLGLPDGTEVGPANTPNYDAGSGNLIPDAPVAFQIKAPAKGRYVLRVIVVHLGEQRVPGYVHETQLTI
jgi:hypothetical protein